MVDPEALAFLPIKLYRFSEVHPEELKYEAEMVFVEKVCLESNYVLGVLPVRVVKFLDDLEFLLPTAEGDLIVPENFDGVVAVGDEVFRADDVREYPLPEFLDDLVLVVVEQLADTDLKVLEVVIALELVVAEQSFFLGRLLDEFFSFFLVEHVEVVVVLFFSLRLAVLGGFLGLLV